jgi:Flp pilus assembly protein TadB
VAATQTTPTERQQEDRRPTRPDRQDRPERQERHDRHDRQEPAPVKNARRLVVGGTVLVVIALLLCPHLLNGFGWLSWPAAVIAGGVLVPLALNNSYSSIEAIRRSIGAYLAASVAVAVWFYGALQLKHNLWVALVCLLVPAAIFGLFRGADDYRRNRQKVKR